VAIIKGAYFERLSSLIPSLRQDNPLPPPLPSELTLLDGPGDADFGLVLGAVDVSGDRRPDLLIGAPKETYEPAEGDPMPQAGAVYALLATPRGRWFASQGAGDPMVVDLADLRAPGSSLWGNPPFSLIWLRGVRAHGRFGTAMAGSSHLNQSELGLAYRNAYTYIFEPGFTGQSRPNAGRIWSFFVPGVLPCESHDQCILAAP